MQITPLFSFLFIYFPISFSLFLYLSIICFLCFSFTTPSAALLSLPYELTGVYSLFFNISLFLSFFILKKKAHSLIYLLQLFFVVSLSVCLSVCLPACLCVFRQFIFSFRTTITDILAISPFILFFFCYSSFSLSPSLIIFDDFW